MTDLVTTETTALSDTARTAVYTDLMDETPVQAEHIVIPRLLLMQSMSKRVQDEKARTGEIRGSIDNNILGVKEESGNVTPFEFIPFRFFRTWQRFTVDGKEWVKEIELTPENAGMERVTVFEEDEVEYENQAKFVGQDIANYETLNYYCILPIEMDGPFMPYIISFNKTGIKAGKDLETARAKLSKFGKPLPFWTFNLGATVKENDKKQTWYIFDVAKGRNTTDAELEAVAHWNAIAKTSDIKVDNSEMEEEVELKNVTPTKVNDSDEY